MRGWNLMNNIQDENIKIDETEGAAKTGSVARTGSAGKAGRTRAGNAANGGITRRNFAKAAFLSAAAAGMAIAGVGCSSGGHSKESSGSDFASLEAATLKVGAGSALIKLDKYCPIKEENTQAGQSKGKPSFVHAEGTYTNVHKGHDLRFNIVLLEVNDEKYAISSIEHVNPTNIDDDKALIEKLTGVAADHQWYHNPHVLSAPHDINQKAINAAIKEACASATSKMKDAKFGYGEGITYANTNRCYETNEGWSQVSNDNGNTDHVLPVLRFDGVDGKPIAILYTVNMASGTLENAMNSETDKNGRQITCDIAGLSERAIEKYYGGDCVAIYFAGCTGDQWGAVRAEYNYVSGSQDNLKYEHGFFDNAAGWTLLDMASSRLAVSVIDTVNKIESSDIHKVTYTNQKFEYKQLDKDKLMSGDDPKVFNYVQSESEPTCTTDVSILAFDDVAITGVKPEMNIQSLKDIRESSPYKYNIMQNWVSYDGASVQGYLPDQQGFDQSGKQASKTSFMPGSAEEMVGHAVDMLKEAYSDK